MRLYIALGLVADLQLDNVDVDFVLDIKKIIDYFKIWIDDVTEFGCITYACKQLFQNTFQNSHINVKFNRRQANDNVHALVKIVSFNVLPPLLY